MKSQNMSVATHPRAQPQKPLKFRGGSQPQDAEMPSFWLFYFLLLIGSVIPIVGVFPAFILFSFAKNAFFRMLPLAISLATSGYALYLRAHSGSVFQQLKNLVY
ncbi:hypothetical protein EHO59_16370 [Leptospira semungkisensis]|uniref:Uncharacterized protein n=1 Tax=Leptospira semungkisensis TaxID=2484985 RepID=A0A4R9FMI1_9LEPT|nr:hypothetical protein [Leptospira semungkisensis]TGJ99434.1 hypothetical protein EHO59_16370 [Leptospira semungkisensis]